MNKREMKKMEAGLQNLSFAQVEGALLSFSDMKEQVLEKCAQRMGPAAETARQQNIKARLHQTRRVVLAAACLMIGVCVYSMLFPAPTSTANDIVKPFNLQIDEITESSEEVPITNEAQEIPMIETSDYSGLADLAKRTGFIALEPMNLPEGMSLTSIKSKGTAEYTGTIAYRYSNGKDEIYFEAFKFGAGGASIFEKTTVRDTQVGTFYVYDTTVTTNALLVDDRLGLSYQIMSTIKGDAFLKILDSMRKVN